MVRIGFSRHIISKISISNSKARKYAEECSWEKATAHLVEIYEQMIEQKAKKQEIHIKDR